MAIVGGAMTIPDYVAIGVLFVLIVWAVADRFPRGISEALKARDPT